MLQWSRPGYGNENAQDPLAGFSNKFMEMRFEDNDDSLEELTTITYETRTETIPPIVTPTAFTTEELASSSQSFMKHVVSDRTEQTPDTFTEAPIVSIEAASKDEQLGIPMRQMNSKAIKPRLYEAKTDDIILKPSQRRDDETVEILTDEDTTPIAELDAEINDTNIDFGEEETTIQPPTSKKPKKIEIYKTRPNELLRHYVEDSHLRSPIAALIDKKSNPLGKAKKLWKAALRPNSLLDIMVVSYDSEGKLITFLSVYLLTIKLTTDCRYQKHI